MTAKDVSNAIKAGMPEGTLEKNLEEYELRIKNISDPKQQIVVKNINIGANIGADGKVVKSMTFFIDEKKEEQTAKEKK